ncbi:MAG: FAD-dependent oxidoreductase, partial [Gaiella sp.]
MRSLWLQEALAQPGEDGCPPLAGEARADVCIVGGGYAGLWTALRLKELDPSCDVAVVESDICGGGASGRNGGFVLTWWAKFASFQKTLGTDEAVRLATASADAVGEIGRFCDAHGIDAHFRPDGWLWAATSQPQMGAWEPTLAAVAAAGQSPFRLLTAEETAEAACTPTHLGGVFEEIGASVQPALLARGLRRVALERGVRIYEGSPMTSLVRDRPPRVRTAGGSITATTVVLALNAWIARLPELRRSLAVVASDVVATEPVPEVFERIGWDTGLCVSDCKMLVNYYRTTRDGRMAWGKGGGALAFGGRVGKAFEGPSPRAAGVAAEMRAGQPALAAAKVTHSWNGPIDRTPAAVPFFGRLGGRDDVLYGFGFSGNGVGPTFVAGRILASRALRRDDEWAAAGFPETPHGHFPRNRAGWFPREPARYVGGRVVRAAVARKERAEDAGRAPSRLDVRLTGLAPAGL